MEENTWMYAKLRNGVDGFVTREGEWSEEKPDFVLSLNTQSLTDTIVYWKPHGVVVRDFKIPGQVVLNLYDMRSKEWLGPVDNLDEASRLLKEATDD